MVNQTGWNSWGLRAWGVAPAGRRGQWVCLETAKQVQQGELPDRLLGQRRLEATARESSSSLGISGSGRFCLLCCPERAAIDHTDRNEIQ